jgi:hypothetical protein
MGRLFALWACAASLQDAPAPRPDAARVDAFDRVIQGRFQAVRDEDVAQQRLGMKRVMAPPPSPHGSLTFKAETDAEEKALEGLRGWTVSLYGGGNTRRMALKGKPFGPVLAAGSAEPAEREADVVGALMRRAIADRVAVRDDFAGAALEARPVLASAKLCLDCHRGRKVGEPLGAVVYLFRSSPVAIRQ